MFLAFDTILLFGKGLLSLLFCLVFIFGLFALITLLLQWGRDRKRLWIHRQIAHMRGWFIVFACSVVIVVPTVLFSMADYVFFSPEEVSLENATQAASDATLNSADLSVQDVGFNPLTNSFLNAIAGESPKANLDFSGIFYVLVSLLGYLVFSGFTVAMFTSMLNHKMMSISNGEELYRKLDEHIVIIGSGRFLIPLVKRILDSSSLSDEAFSTLFSRLKHGVKELLDICGEKAYQQSQIVILTSESIPELRKRLTAHLGDSKLKRMKRIVLIHGDRTNKENLKQLCLSASKEIYLMGDSEEPDLDDRNIESLTHINNILSSGKQSGVKKCKMYLERYHTYNLFQVFIKETKLAHLDLEPICFYKHWAEIVLGIRESQANCLKMDGSVPSYLKMDGIALGTEKFVHLVVIGMSRMGMSLVTEAAMHLHFSNSDKKRTRITMIDLNARQEMYKFVNLNQNLFNEAYYTYREYTDTPFGGCEPTFSERNQETGWLDTEFHFVQGNVESNDVRELLQSFVEEKDVCLTVAVCLPDARYALSVALSLPHELYNRDNVSILVQQELGEGLLNLLRGQSKETPNYANVLPFGMLNEEIGTESDLEKFAPYVWTIYDPNCAGEQTWESLEERLKDPRLIRDMYTKWESMQPWERISNRYASMSSFYKEQTIFGGKMPENPEDVYNKPAEVFGRMEHNRWCVEKLFNGFRTLTKEEIESAEYFEKREDWKKERFAHYGICKWDEICKRKNDGDKGFVSFYWNSINMGRAICRLCDIEKIILRWKYSSEENKKENKKIKTFEYKPEQEPCMCEGWGAKLVTEYSKEGKMTKEMCLGVDEKPCLNKERYAGRLWEYDENGNLKKQMYFGEDGMPCMYKNLYAGIKMDYEYHEGKAYLAKQMYFGIDGETPCLCEDDYAEIRFEYASQGDGKKEFKKTKETYFDEKGNCIGTKNL